MVGTIILYVVLGLVLLLVIWFIATYNMFIRLKNGVEESFSTMDVYLKKRFDLIPNYVETVKGYAKHESETLTKVIEARNMAGKANTTEEKMKYEGQVSEMIRNLMVVVEQYPDLKANTNFLALQEQLNSLEGEIANSRKYYNALVKEFNIKVETFPSNLIAKLLKFQKKALFVVDDVTERKNVKVEF